MHTQKRVAQPELTPLTVEEVRRLPKVHIGFEAFVEPLAEIAETFADDMGRGGIDLSSMREALAAYQDLAAAHEEAKQKLALIADTRRFNAAKVWSQELIIYNRARAAGPNECRAGESHRELHALHEAARAEEEARGFNRGRSPRRGSSYFSMKCTSVASEKFQFTRPGS